MQEARLRHDLTAVKLAVALALIVGEVLTTSLLFSFELDLPRWQHPVVWVRQAGLLAIVAAAAFAVLAWPRRREIRELLRSTPHNWTAALVLNGIVYVALTATTIAFTRHAAQSAVPPWHWFWAYSCLLAADGLSLVWLVAPIAFWRAIVRRYTAEWALAIAAGGAALQLGALAPRGWAPLAGATLMLSHGLLALVEPEAFVDYATAELGAADFSVLIDQACSGYEGIGLVAAFLLPFWWTFRDVLRFPHALLLLPCGMLAIWLLNSVRIALLVSLGAHVSPEIALSGFHSQAGWMTFLAVTLGLMAAALRVPFFCRAATPSPAAASQVPEQAARHGDRLMLALLLPFMAVMAAGIVAAACAPYDHWLYGLKIVAGGAVLWLYRDIYRPWLTAVSPLALLAGLAVGAGWIATDSGVMTQSATSTWLKSQSSNVAALWLVMRAVGAIVIVPVVEELALRGLLYRWLISPRFETVAFDRLSWLALLISSVLFGLMHERWMAAGIAGALFACLMIRSNRLGDAVAAHVAANAVIVLWAILARQWSLL